MSDIKIGVAGLEFQTELTITQVPVASGAGGIVIANNLATFTFAGAHGLTLTPAAGVPANYFVAFTGVAGMTGSGTFNGPIFRVLSIPSATTLVVYAGGITAATFAAGTCVPVFLFPFTGQVGTFVNGPLMSGVSVAPPNLGSGLANLLLGVNCSVQWNPDNTSIIVDPTVGFVPAVAPVYRISETVSSSASNCYMSGASSALFASGGAGTTRVSVIQ